MKWTYQGPTGDRKNYTLNCCFDRLVSDIKAEEAHKEAVAAEESQGVVEEMPSAQEQDASENKPQEPTSRYIKGL